MLRNLLKIIAVIFVLAGTLVIATITVVDRTPYQETPFYAEMDQLLDSLHEHLRYPVNHDPLGLGWAKVNITPATPVPLAGYGARDPKIMQGIKDSSYVRTVVFKKGSQKSAFITADLLIIHPEVSQKVLSTLPEGWKPNEVYFTATHTHSGQGGWAPGLVGKLFSGEFQDEIVTFLAKHIVASIEQASEDLTAGSLGFGELSVDNLVRNRLVNDAGITDPWLKVIQLQKDSLRGLLNFYSAHATCMTHRSHQLSGDFPGALTQVLEAKSSVEFAAYGAGAVGSMGPDVKGPDDSKKIDYMVYHLADQLSLLQMIGIPSQEIPYISTFRVKIPLRDPFFKVTQNLALRPYLFRMAFGDYPAYLSVLRLGNTVLIGLPCDFSGELAVPLYEAARSMGLNLIITSFNGSYIGYVIRDEWYDLEKYEARTMSWYGPDTGTYFSEIISRILDAINESDNPDFSPNRR